MLKQLAQMLQTLHPFHDFVSATRGQWFVSHSLCVLTSQPEISY
jgi:hypothetical protein